MYAHAPVVSFMNSTKYAATTWLLGVWSYGTIYKQDAPCSESFSLNSLYPRLLQKWECKDDAANLKINLKETNIEQSIKTRTQKKMF